MFVRFLFFALLWSAPATILAADFDRNTVSGRTIIHVDGTKTESIIDPSTLELTEKTFDANDVLLTRRSYKLNERGQPVMGNIYDGAGNLQARSQSFFDPFGRLQEERISNLQGEVFQQVLHEYAADGTAQKPKVINYKVNSPTMRPALIDYTRQQPPALAATQPQTTGASRVQPPIQVPEDLSPIVAPTGNTPKPEPEKKKGFFGRLFKK